MDSAEILARRGNWAVVQIPSRAFAALAAQGDTFFNLADGIRRGIAACTDGTPKEELIYALAEMESSLAWYADVLQVRGSDLPWYPQDG